MWNIEKPMFALVYGLVWLVCRVTTFTLTTSTPAIVDSIRDTPLLLDGEGFDACLDQLTCECSFIGSNSGNSDNFNLFQYISNTTASCTFTETEKIGVLGATNLQFSEYFIVELFIVDGINLIGGGPNISMFTSNFSLIESVLVLDGQLSGSTISMTEISFFGSRLLNSSEAHCLIKVDEKWHASPAVFISSTKYICQLNPLTSDAKQLIDQIVPLRLSMSMHPSESIPNSSPFHFTFVMPPPKFNTIRLSFGGSLLQVLWDFPVTPRYNQCTKIFDENTVSSFGDLATCVWVSNLLVNVQLGKDNTVTPSSVVSPVLHTLIREGARLPNLALTAVDSGVVELLPGESPELTIFGPDEVSPSTCLHGRGEFTAHVDGAFKVSELTTFLWTLNGDSVGISTVNIPLNTLTDLSPGAYVLSVSVESFNYTILSANRTITILADDTDKEIGFFWGGKSRIVFKGRNIPVEAIVVCKEYESMEYSMSLSEIAGNEVVNMKGLHATLLTSSLQVGSYMLTLFREKGNVIATQIIQVVYYRLEASLLGGSLRTVAPNVPFTLKVVFLNDQTNPETIISWACDSCPTSLSPFVKDKNLTLEGLSLPVLAGNQSEYNFKTMVFITDGPSLTLESTVLVGNNFQFSAGAEGSLINVYQSFPGDANPAEDLVLHCVLMDSPLNQQLGILEWSSVMGVEYPGISDAIDLGQAAKSRIFYDLENVSSPFYVPKERPQVLTLIVDSSFLSYDRKYMFEASIKKNGDLLAKASITVSTADSVTHNALSQLDRITILTSSGLNGDTRFSLHANGYQANKYEDMVFKYAYRVSSDPRPIIIEVSNSPTLENVALPFQTTHVGLTCTSRLPIPIFEEDWVWKEVSLSEKLALDSIEDLLDNRSAMEVSHLLASLVKLSTFQRNLTLPLLSVLKNLTCNFNEPSWKASVLLGIAHAISFAKTITVSNEAKNLAGHILECVVRTITDTYPVDFFPTDVESVLNTFESFLNKSTVQAIASHQDFAGLSSFASAINMASKFLCGHLAFGETQLEISNDIFSVQVFREQISSITVDRHITLSIGYNTERNNIACAASLLNSNETSRDSCDGTCLIVSNVHGDLLSILEDEKPQNITVRSDVVTHSMSSHASRHQRALDQIYVSITVEDECDCHCRVWNAVSNTWDLTESSYNMTTKEYVCEAQSTESDSVSVALFQYCAPGYLGRGCATQCVLGTFGSNCDFVQNCSGNGNAHHVTGACSCSSGYTGTICELKCSDPIVRSLYNSSSKFNQGYGIDCSQSCPCNDEGTQSCNIHNGSCTCIQGFTGTFCDVNLDDCANDPCQHAGICADLVDSFACNCTGTGFTGTLCELNIDDCNLVRCENQGVCEDLVNDFRCSCPPGFQGDYCESYCESGTFGQNCSQSCSCGEHGFCNEINGSCLCLYDYFGDTCEETNTAEAWILAVAIVVPIFLFLFCCAWWLIYHYLQDLHKNDKKHESGLERGEVVGSDFQPEDSDNDTASLDGLGEGDGESLMKNYEIQDKSRSTDTATFIKLDPSASLSDVRDLLITQHSVLLEGHVFHFEKSDKSGSYAVAQEISTFVGDCYPDTILISTYEPTGPLLLDFCVCGKPSGFECSQCTMRGYCSSVCQASDWSHHKQTCKGMLPEDTNEQDSDDHSNDGKEICVCGKVALFDCSKCGTVSYCSVQCQRQHWHRHKVVCKSLESKV
eukprot:m.25513 g.25513  ORF g.25513 m.25513 type:complete len:1702 (+) comp7711_c0_seq2:128-5233(+)